jgi:hypothetical protein
MYLSQSAHGLEVVARNSASMKASLKARVKASLLEITMHAARHARAFENRADVTLGCLPFPCATSGAIQISRSYRHKK